MLILRSTTVYGPFQTDLSSPTTETLPSGGPYTHPNAPPMPYGRETLPTEPKSPGWTRRTLIFGEDSFSGVGSPSSPLLEVVYRGSGPVEPRPLPTPGGHSRRLWTFPDLFLVEAPWTDLPSPVSSFCCGTDGQYSDGSDGQTQDCRGKSRTETDYYYHDFYCCC